MSRLLMAAPVRCQSSAMQMINPAFKAAQRHRSLAVRTGAATSTEATATASSSSQPNWQIKMLYDGDCPLCMREVEMLMRRDAGNGRIAFVDIAAPDYDPQLHAGISFKQAMERIHAVLPDGTIVQDVEVFRRLYEQVGLGWVYAITRLKPVEDLANKVYDVWAKYRLPLTGRPDLAVVLQEKKACRTDGSNCDQPQQ